MEQIESSSNAVPITVSELAQALKQTVEARFGYVRVRGEISGYRGPHASGHAYFTLKDAQSRLDAIIWRATFLRLPIKPEDGVEVVALGRITTFPSKSSYQIVIESIQIAGIGELLSVLERRKKTLAAEGIFEASHKRRLPFLPQVVGLVTSPSGSVIRDIIQRLADRSPCRVLVWPVRVQGQGSAEEIAAAIRGMNELAESSPAMRSDVLIVARGGGSLEDLWSFNEEVVVRAVFDSRIPLISAVGHETDWSLSDYAADIRAATPTAAAEICTPVKSELRTRAEGLAERRSVSFRLAMSQRQTSLVSTTRRLTAFFGTLLFLKQRLAHLSLLTRTWVGETHRLKSQMAYECAAAMKGRVAPALIDSRRARLGNLTNSAWMLVQRRLMALRQKGLRNSVTFDEQKSSVQRRASEAFRRVRLDLEMQQRYAHTSLTTENITISRMRFVYARLREEIKKRRLRIDELTHTLAVGNRRTILERGFALVYDRRGAAIRSYAEASKAELLTLEFLDGRIEVRTIRERKRRKDLFEARQGRLL